MLTRAVPTCIDAASMQVLHVPSLECIEDGANSCWNPCHDEESPGLYDSLNKYCTRMRVVPSEMVVIDPQNHDGTASENSLQLTRNMAMAPKASAPELPWSFLHCCRQQRTLVV